MPDFRIKLVYESNQDDNRFFKHFIAGALAGGTARTITAPLDRLKVMSQTRGKTIYPPEGIRMMIREGGIRSMWRGKCNLQAYSGNGMNCLGVVPEVAIKFALFHDLKKRAMEYRRRSGQPLTIQDRALAAALSGVAAHVMTHPISVIKTRLVLRKTGDPNGIGLIRRGYQLHGWKFFYKGFFTAVSGIFIFSSIDLTTYEYFRRIYKKDRDQMSVSATMLCGSISSLLALVTVYPIFLLTTNLQASDENFRLVVFAQRIRKKGPQILYSGLPATLLKGLPAMVIGYTVYEMILGLLGEDMI